MIETTGYLVALLGTDQYKEIQETVEQVALGEKKPEEFMSYLTKILITPQLRLTKTTSYQQEQLGRLLGWVHNYVAMLYTIGRFKAVNVKDVLEEAKKIRGFEDPQYVSKLKDSVYKWLEYASTNIIYLFDRVLVDILFWLGILPSTGGYAFERLTASTKITHQIREEEMMA